MEVTQDFIRICAFLVWTWVCYSSLCIIRLCGRQITDCLASQTLLLHQVILTRVVRWIRLLSAYLLPIDSFEKLVLHDISDLKPDIWISHKNLSHYISGHRGEVLGQDNAPRVDHLDYLLSRHRWNTSTRAARKIIILLSDSNFHGFRSKWSETTQQLANQNSKAPDIGLISISSAD